MFALVKPSRAFGRSRFEIYGLFTGVNRRMIRILLGLYWGT